LADGDGSYTLKESKDNGAARSAATDRVHALEPDMRPPLALILLGPLAGVLTLVAWFADLPWLFWPAVALLALDIAIGILTGAKPPVPAIQLIGGAIALSTLGMSWYLSIPLGVAVGSLVEGLGRVAARYMMRTPAG
jgi:hypothetical protein